MDSNRIANPTDDHDQTQQPMEDMEVEVSSYQDTYNGTKFPVSETVTIGSGMQVEAENNTIDLDSAIKLEEVTVDTKAHIDSLIFNNEKFVCSPKGPYPQEDQEDYDNDLKEIQEAVRSDVDKIPVKRMRRLVPKMRMAVYMSQDEIRSKRKHKHLWDERPADWEESVPFKDPNNKTGKEGKKPGKEILTQMFILLKKKFVAMCSAPKSDEPKVEKMDSLQVQQPSEETLSIPAPTQEQEPIIIGTTGVQPEQPVEYSQQNLNAEVNDPVSGLYRRIEQKIRQVEVLVAEYEGCREALHQVFQDIIKSLYIQSKAVTMCGFFLDAGHDLENLLDKGLAFGKLLDASVIKQGCLMICTKYAATQRKFGANLQNIETPIYHVKEEVSEEASATRAQALRQNSIPARMSQTVSDGCAPVYIKQEPMSPGLPFSPANDLANQMGNVNLQEDFDLKVYGISAKPGNQELSSLIDIRTPEDAVNELFDLAKDTNKDSKSGFDRKSGSELDRLVADLFKDMPDSPHTETMTPTSQTTPLNNEPDQNLINEAIRLTKELNGAPQQIVNDVNLNSTCEMSEDALFETVLSLQQDFKWQPADANSVEASQVSIVAVTNPVYNTPINTFPSQPVGQVGQPTIQFNSPSNFANTLPNHMPQRVPQMNQSPAQSVPGIASAGQMPGTPCVPTTVMDIMNSEGEDADKRNGGGKVTNQRHRSVRQGKVTKKGKGKDKYFHV